MSWFSNLVHKFEHVLRHVGAIAGDVLAASFGFPPGAGFAAVELLMHAHAGDPHARANIARLSQNPKMRAYCRRSRGTYARIRTMRRFAPTPNTRITWRRRPPGASLRPRFHSTRTATSRRTRTPRG